MSYCILSATLHFVLHVRFFHFYKTYSLVPFSSTHAHDRYEIEWILRISILLLFDFSFWFSKISILIQISPAGQASRNRLIEKAVNKVRTRHLIKKALVRKSAPNSAHFFHPIIGQQYPPRRTESRALTMSYCCQLKCGLASSRYNTPQILILFSLRYSSGENIKKPASGATKGRENNLFGAIRRTFVHTSLSLSLSVRGQAREIVAHSSRSDRLFRSRGPIYPRARATKRPFVLPRPVLRHLAAARAKSILRVFQECRRESTYNTPLLFFSRGLLGLPHTPSFLLFRHVDEAIKIASFCAFFSRARHRFVATDREFHDGDRIVAARVYSA